MALSPAEILLLIFAAHGGVMDRADAEREWYRVMALSAADRAEWERHTAEFIRAMAGPGPSDLRTH